MMNTLHNFDNNQHGFTLVEVLVAIAIFAVLSATGWITIQQISQGKAITNQKAQQLEALQWAYKLIQRDCIQMVGQPMQSGAQTNSQWVPVLQQNAISLALTGKTMQVADVLELSNKQQGNASPAVPNTAYFLQRITYRVMDGQLVRQITPLGAGRLFDKPKTQVLLKNLEAAQFVSYNPQAQNTWPSNDLQVQMQNAQNSNNKMLLVAQTPQAVSFSFKQQGISYQWYFLLGANQNGLFQDVLNGNNTSGVNSSSQNNSFGNTNNGNQSSTNTNTTIVGPAANTTTPSAVASTSMAEAL